MMCQQKTHAVCAIVAMVKLSVPKESVQHHQDLRYVHLCHHHQENAVLKLSLVMTALLPLQVHLTIALHQLESISMTQKCLGLRLVTLTAGVSMGKSSANSSNAVLHQALSLVK
jgi:hypothetical protein